MPLLPRLNLRRRVALLVGGRWLVVLAGVLAVGVWRNSWALVGAIVLGGVLGMLLKAVELSQRRRFVREAPLPGFLVQKLRAAHPQLLPRDAELVLHGLRQFFIAYLRGGRRFVAMPSRVVDTAWHEFILHTRAYQRWCATAFGGMLHHSPAEVLGRDARRNDGLRRSWYWACKEESIDPRHPARLPLLFALDAKFAIANGFRYVPDCSDIDRQSGSGAHCGGDFSDGGSGPGDADGLGGSDASSGGDGGSDGGGGCGGD